MVAIREIGSRGPLIWPAGGFTTTPPAPPILPGFVPLPLAGENGKVAGEFSVPQGTYLVQAISYRPCGNRVTQIAWVQVNDGETATVNLVPTTVRWCADVARIGVAFGTAFVGNRHVPITQIAPAEAKAFIAAAAALKAKLPTGSEIPLPTDEQLKKLD